MHKTFGTMTRREFVRLLGMGTAIGAVSAMTACKGVPFFKMGRKDDKESSLSDVPSLIVCKTGTLTSFSMDPMMANIVDTIEILNHVMSGLARWRIENGVLSIMPEMATTLSEPTENGDKSVTYEYSIIDGATWSDGEPVSADDFVFAWNRAANIMNGGVFRSFFDCIKGYSDSPDMRLAVEAVNERTLRVTLSHDLPYWNELLAIPPFFPMRRDFVESQDPTDYAWRSPSNAVAFPYDGPYVISDFVQSTSETASESFVMRKREEYPYAKDITVGEIRFVYNKPASEVISLMGEPGSADMALSDGTVSVVHVLASPTDSVLRQTKDMPTVNRRAIPLLGTEALIWNVNKRLLPDTSPLMGDDYEKAQAEIRHAFALLVDRENAVKNRYGYEPAASIVPPGISDTGGYDFAANAGDSKEYDGYIDTTSGSTERNKAEAVAILRKYYMYDEGIGQFTDVPPLTMLGAQKNQSKDYYTDSFISACASLGIVIAYENQSYADVVARQERGEYEISTTNWFADFADPSSFLSIYTTDNALNLCQFGRGQHQAARIYSIDLSAISENATIAAASWTDTYDVLTDLGATETDKSKRSVLLHQAEDLVMGTWAIMPVWHAGDSYIARKEISGIEATPFNWTFYGHVMQSEEL